MDLKWQVGGDFADVAEFATERVRKAATKTIRDMTTATKEAMRADVIAAGLGPRLARTVRSEVYPRNGDSLSAAGFVWVKPGKTADSRGAEKIIRAFEEGARITPTTAGALAIPTEGAPPRIGRFATTPKRWEAKTGQKLRFVPRKGKNPILVADNMRARAGRRGGFAQASKRAVAKGQTATVAMFTLVRAVRVKKRLDLAATVAKTTSGFQARFDENLGIL